MSNLTCPICGQTLIVESQNTSTLRSIQCHECGSSFKPSDAIQALPKNAINSKPARTGSVTKTKRVASSQILVIAITAAVGVIGLVLVTVCLFYFLSPGDPELTKTTAVQLSPEQVAKLNPKLFIASQSLKRDVQVPQSQLSVPGKSSLPILFDQPLQDVVVSPPKPSSDNQFPAPFVDASIPEPPKNEDVVFQPEELVEGGVPSWNVAPDPVPVDRPFVIAADLEIVLNNIRNDRGIAKGVEEVTAKPQMVSTSINSLIRLNPRQLPILACQDGPFALLLPQLDKSVYGWKLYSDGKNWVRYESFNQAKEALTVIDLSTGQKVGEFDSRVPFWAQPVLSPDGKTLVGPSSEVPIAELKERVPTLKSADDERRRKLYVWKQGSRKAPMEIAPDGIVTSMTFANDRALVLLVEGEQRRIEVWDVSNGNRVRNVPIGSSLRYSTDPNAEELEPSLVENPPARPNIMTVSCSGKYAAAASKDGIHLVSLIEGKVIGVMPMKSILRGFELSDRTPRDNRIVAAFKSGLAKDVVALKFLPEGDKLVAIYKFDDIDHSPNVLLEYNFTNGTIVSSYLVTSLAQGIFQCDFAERMMACGVFFGTHLFDMDRCFSYQEKDLSHVLRFSKNGPLLVYNENPARPSIRTVQRATLISTREAQIGLRRSDPRGEVPLKEVAQGDRSSSVNLVPNPTNEPPPLSSWVAPTPTKTRTLPSWASGWSLDKGLILNQKDELRGKVLATLIDFNSAEDPNSAKPFVLSNQRKFSEEPYLTLAMSEQADIAAFADPVDLGVVHMWSLEKMERLYSFDTMRNPTSLISWLGFDSNGDLLVLEDGTVTCWNVKARPAKARYSVHGKYSKPIHLSLNRKVLFIGREHAIDVIDTASGRCIRRLYYSPFHYPLDVSPSPDGVHVAVLFDYRPAQGTSNGVDQPIVVIWNLVEGNAKVSQVDRNTVQVSWPTANHLYVQGGKSEIFDLRLQSPVMRFDGRMRQDFAGRYWFRSKDSQEYKLASISGKRTEHEIGILEKPESIVDFCKVPVQLVIDAADEQLAYRHGERILKGLQTVGWNIGPGKHFIHLSVESKISEFEIEMSNREKFRVPRLVYTWRLMDDQGRLFDERLSHFSFDEKNSIYYNAKAGKFPLEFGRREPVAAIIEEMLEKSVSYLYCPFDSPQIYLQKDKETSQLPLEVGLSLSE